MGDEGKLFYLKHMKIYTLHKKQLLPISMETAWDFFSSPENLKEITPKHMGFKIISKLEGEKMYPGMIVRYIVTPLLGIPLHWVTEITHVNEPSYFVDEQRFGPYGFWHHQHKFKATADGVEMDDIVNYGLPLGFIGRIAHSVFVRKQLEHIFNYRYSILEEYFKGNTAKPNLTEALID